MLTVEQKEILNGLMLGDGFLEKKIKCKNACLRITRKRTDKEYLIHHANVFHDMKPNVKDDSIFDKRTMKTYYQSRLRTSVNVELTALWSKWYHDSKKVIPEDLIISPLTLATWFADDGSVTIKKRYYTVKLSTHCFSQQENQFLISILKRDLGLHFKMYMDTSKNKKHYFLMLTNKKDVKSFIKIIDPVFPQGMERKSQLWRNNKELLSDKTYPNCKFCNSNNICKNGFDKRKIQKYLCKICKRQFT